MLIYWSSALAWTMKDGVLYQRRQFIELEQNLILKKSPRLALFIQNQRQDILGCKEIVAGNGREQSFLKCLKFLNRETEMGLWSLKRTDLINDMNTVCRKFAEKPRFVRKILDQSPVFREKKPWKECHGALWKQIYLTATANFLADPVGATALMRRAESSLGADERWHRKVRRFFDQR